MTHENMNPRDAELANLLEAAAHSVHPNPVFKAELENKLKSAHKPRAGFTARVAKNIFPVLGFSSALILLAVLLSWAIRNLAPNPPQPAAGDTPSACPVTEPNGSLPPGETVPSPEYLGYDQLWTVLWPEGRVLVTPANREPDGAYSMKWGWWRAVNGALTIEGRRLDANSPPLRADIPDGYGDTGFQVSTLIFPEPGCWEVTGRVAGASLTFITEVIFVEEIPTPEAVATEVNAVRPVGKAYDWNGMQLYLSAPLPELSGGQPLYAAQLEQPATLESARALAAQFGMDGQAYLIPPEVPGAAGGNFLFVDGNQRLQIRSDQYFSYYPDYTRLANSYNAVDDPNAEAIIRDFLAARGFDFEYALEPAEMTGAYSVLPLTPDGLTIRHEYFATAGLNFQFDKDGLFSVTGNLINYAPVDNQTYRIISAEEAFQKLLDPNATAGFMIGQTSAYQPLQGWTRPRRENETITVWGWMNSYPSAEGGAPLVNLDGFAALGNIADVEESMPNTFVEAAGQFQTMNGATVFNVESWKAYEGYEDGIFGSLQRDGDNIVLTSEAGVFILPDVPADVPVPSESVYVTGVGQGDIFEWKTIDNRLAHGGGGSGGGGVGFYKINLSGTPVPFPTPGSMPPISSGDGFAYTVAAGDTCMSIASTFNVTLEELVAVNNLPADCSTLQIDQVILIPSIAEPAPTQLAAQRGILSITIFEQTDGSQRVQYGFITGNPEYFYVLLEGDNLEELQSYNSRPVDVWGTLSTNADGFQVVTVERFEIPFPDLQFQILKGTEKNIEIDGRTVLLFTGEDGRDYVELAPNCYDIIGVDSVMGTGREGELILLEALAVPNLTFGGYPAICVFSTSMAINPKNNQPMELTITADQISLLPEPPSAVAGNLPTLTIEKVELVYYVPAQRYITLSPGGPGQTQPVYIQPAWRFYGRYSDGTIFEAIIQALDPLFLLPETEEPYLPG